LARASSKVVPAIRPVVYDKLTAAQACLDEEDVPCAEELLEDVGNIRDLNSYESAQILNFRAYLYIDLDNYQGAIDAYKTLLAIPRTELPDGLIESSMRNLATIYLQQDQMEEGLAMYLEWMALPSVTPASSDYNLLATIYYQLERYQDGLDAIDQAIKLAQDKGEIGEENWHVLKYVLHYQLEEVDEAIAALTFVVNNWTKRNHVITLAGLLQSRELDNETMALFEAAHEKGWLIQSTQLVQLASFYMKFIVMPGCRSQFILARIGEHTRVEPARGGVVRIKIRPGCTSAHLLTHLIELAGAGE
jgi:tetratricopeptide (TPR) repeat protein